MALVACIKVPRIPNVLIIALTKCGYQRYGRYSRSLIRHWITLIRLGNAWNMHKTQSLALFRLITPKIFLIIAVQLVNVQLIMNVGKFTVPRNGCKLLYTFMNKCCTP